MRILVKTNLIAPFSVLGVLLAVIFFFQNCGQDFMVDVGFENYHSVGDDSRGDDDRGGDSGFEIKQKPEYRVRFGDHRYMINVLSQVFLPASGSFNNNDNNINNKIRGLIENNLEAFGGACQVHDGDCPKNALTTAVMDPVAPSSTIRSSLARRACSETLDINRAVNNALANAGIGNINSALNSENIIKAYQLFYSYRQPASDQIASLENLASTVLHDMESQREAWRLVLIAICSSSGWHIP